MQNTKATDWIADAVAVLPPLLTADEAMRVLRVRRRKLNYMVAAHAVDGVRHRQGGGAPLLITRVSIERYLRSMTAERAA